MIRTTTLLLVCVACATQPTFTPVVAFESPEVESRSDRVEVFLTSSPCADAASAASPPVASAGEYVVGPRVLRRGGAGDAFGEVAPGQAAWLWARALGSDCDVLASGCVRVDLTRGGGEVRVVLRALPAPRSLCRTEERCEMGRCVTAPDAMAPDVAEDASVDDGPLDATTMDADETSVDAPADTSDDLRFDAAVETALPDVAVDRAVEAAVDRPDATAVDVPPRCTGSQVLCGGACVTLGTDQNCRACGDACGGGDVLCCDGNCVNIRTNNNHCGRCNNPCGGRDDRCCRSMCMQTCP